MLYITRSLVLPDNELEVRAIRAQGAGGQNINKVASAVQLRFDIRASSLPEACKQRLLRCRDRRISQAGVITIKAQRYRSQEHNRLDARERLAMLIRGVMTARRPRVATRVPASEKRIRRAQKRRQAERKALRRKVHEQNDTRD